MKTNKPKLKTIDKTGLNIQISQMLAVNTAQDMKILKICL